MQATKPLTASNGKKCHKSQQASGGGQAKDKSDVQRAIDATIAAKNANSNNIDVCQASTQSATLIPANKSGSNNSVEKDNDAETAANRALQKMNISPVNSNASSNSTINDAHAKRQVATGKHQPAPEPILAKSSTSSLCMTPNAAAASSTSCSHLGQMNGLGACQMQRLAGGSALLEPSRIALDTKVPHPHKLPAAAAFQAAFENDEVSYYNDALPLKEELAPSNGAKSLGHELRPSPTEIVAGGGSLDKNARPKLLLAASQVIGGSQALIGAANQTCYPHQRLKNDQSDGNNNLEVYQNDVKENRQPLSPSYYEHNYMTADYDDLYDVHYHNAPVVEKEAAANKQMQQSLIHRNEMLASGGHLRRYQDAANGQTAMPPSAESLPMTNNHCSTRQMVSISTSPKAKSAPATPCNITPTAFHQVGSHLNSTLNPNLANTLPPDIRKNISSTCRVLPSSAGLASGHTSHAHHQQAVNFKDLDNLIKRGELALAEKDHLLAIELFSEIINLATKNQNVAYLKKNFKVYSQRAEAHFMLGKYDAAIEDSMAARELNPKWTQAYYLQGRAQFMIGQHARSLAVFSFGLTQDPNDKQLFAALVDAALSKSSNFYREFEPKFNKLKSFQLDKRPFVVVAVLGQELLASGHSKHAAVVLESALKLSSWPSSPSTTSSSSASPVGETCLQLNSAKNDQKKFISSVLSTISLAYCMLRDFEKAICYMNKELEIETQLDDIKGQCRVLSNLGYIYYKVRKFDKSLEAHRRQLNLAMRTHLYPQASQALNAIGHVHAAKNDHANALTSHTRCLDILKQLDDDHYAQFKEQLAIGHVHIMLNDLKSAEERFDEASQLLKTKHLDKSISHEKFTTGSILINFNLAHLALKKQFLPNALKHYETVLELTRSLNDPLSTSSGTHVKRETYEMRACSGLGQVCRLLKKFDEARSWFEKQLRLAEILNDLVGQSRALCNLGMISQQFDDHQEAWRFFDRNLKLVESNLLLKAYAHNYMASAYYLMKHWKEARDHYETSVHLFQDLGYFPNEIQAINRNLSSIKRRAVLTDAPNVTPPTAALVGPNNLPAPAAKKVMMAS